MLYFKILMLAVATISALSVFTDRDDGRLVLNGKLLSGSSVLFLVAVIIELISKAVR